MTDKVNVTGTEVEATIRYSGDEGDYKLKWYVFRAEFSDHHARWGAVGFGESIEAATADLYREYEKKDKISD